MQSNIKKTAAEIYGITAYFNPQGIPLLKTNYANFRERLLRQGLKLLVIELSNGETSFDLDKKDAEIVIQVKSKSVLWHKERLLNIGLQNLPKTCTEIVWLDADILFLDNDWVNKTSQLLKTYNILQPFSTVIRLKQGQYELTKPEHEYKLIKKEGGRTVSWCWSCANSVKKHGETGFAWAAKKSIFDDIGFYDKLIVGGADKTIPDALKPRDIINDKKKRRTPFKRLEDDILGWQLQLRARVKNKITYLPGTILHLFHGEKIAECIGLDTYRFYLRILIQILI